jgi:dihydrofolate synthase/folylpolyglutamate synthase
MAEPMIEWLYGLRQLGIKLGLDNIRGLLRLLEHPEKHYRIAHVAGTNGKGSVAAMLDAMLEASGVRSGMFTSPHLVRPNERIRIAGRDIESVELHRRLASMRDRIEGALARGELQVHPSFFEVMTATALESFKDHALKATVLEVGLGGRLDATNAVDPDVCIVVSVGLDHTKTLGGTLERIAGEKAGIIKPGKPVVCGAVQQRPVDVLRDACRKRGARWIDARLAVRLVAEDENGFTLRTSRATYPGLRLSLAGRHQIDNARVALAAFELLAETLGLGPDPDAVRDGLARVRWPGRLQWIRADGDGPDLLLDAAHNPSGLRSLISHLRENELGRPVLLFGATSGKPLRRLLEPLSSFSDAAVLTAPPVERGIDPEELMRIAAPLFERVETLPDPADALRRAQEIAGTERPVLVTGSLYLVGEILGLLSDAEVPGPVAM